MKSIEIYDEVEVCEENLPANQLRQSKIMDYIWSFLGSIIIMFIFVIQEPGKMVHWMLLPLVLCGTIIGADAIRWFKGTYALFDPKGIIGLYGINFFLIAPMLVVFYDVEKVETYTVINWSQVIGLMAVFNAIGLILYKLFEKIAFKRSSVVEKTYWSLNAGKATLYVPIFFAVSFLSLCIFIIRAGGWGGIILQESQSEVVWGLKGFGIIMLLKDALPITTLLLLTVFRIVGFYNQKSRSWLLVAALVVLMFFITSGLRGSRAATAYGIICAGGILHYFWKRFSVKLVLLFLIPLGLFSYIYGFYKSAGIIGLKDLVQGRTTIESLEHQTTRTFTGMLIGDLSRAHVQAAQMDVLVNKPWPYKYRYGKTYPLAIGYLIPRQVWPSKPVDMGRIVAGTEMLYGPDSYGAYVKFGGGGNRSTQLYGLAGEAMLNFGIYGIPLAFMVWGIIIGKIRKRLYAFREGDTRLFMTGFWMLFSFVMLAADVDILIWFFASLYIIPAVLVFLISDKQKIIAD